jgi:hypothetical protein
MNESISKLPKPIPALHLYPYTYAVDDIARDMKMSEVAQRDLLLEMARAVLAGKLRVRNPETGAPVYVTSRMVNPSPYVMVTDVNEWLEKEGRTYSWIPLEITSTEICDLTNAAGGSRGITVSDVAAAFQNIKWDYVKWKKNLSNPAEWILPCRVAKGRRGGKNSSLWNPAQIAIALLDHDIKISKLDAVFINLNDWANEWKESSDRFRN